MPINDISHEATSTALVDADTLADGSVVRLSNSLNDGNRIVMDKEFVTPTSSLLSLLALALKLFTSVSAKKRAALQKGPTAWP